MKERPWDLFKKNQKVSFVDLEKKDYINDEGLEVPENTIAYFPYHEEDRDIKIGDSLESLIGKPVRNYFDIPAFSFCLPLTIGNQYGFVVKAMYDAEIFWDGKTYNIDVKSENFNNSSYPQVYVNDFPGALTIENKFIYRTPPGVNLMTIQPPNYFIRGLHTMTGVVEADNLRRSFTFNLRVTNLNEVIKIKKGDWLAAFIPVPRFYVDSFELKDARKIFSDDVIQNEIESIKKLGWERDNHKDYGGDVGKINGSGRRYFKGLHVNETKYKKHQKRIGDRSE